MNELVGGGMDGATWGFNFICVEITAIYSGMFYQVYVEFYPYQNKRKATY
jgi:hypothetical protein